MRFLFRPDVDFRMPFLAAVVVMILALVAAASAADNARNAERNLAAARAELKRTCGVVPGGVLVAGRIGDDGKLDCQSHALRSPDIIYPRRIP